MRWGRTWISFVVMMMDEVDQEYGTDSAESTQEQMVGGVGYGPVIGGRYAGVPAVKLFVAGNNLVAGDVSDPWQIPREAIEPGEDAEWVDRMIPVWRDGTVMTPEDVVDVWRSHGWLDGTFDFRHLYIGGGEPMLEGWQDGLFDLLKYFSYEVEYEMPKVHVETNGTIAPKSKLRSYIDHFDVNLHLSNSGIEKPKRIKQTAINKYVEIAGEKGWDADFLFIVGERRDLQEVNELSYKFDIPRSQIHLVPPFSTEKEVYERVSEFAEEGGFRFSPRLMDRSVSEAYGGIESD